jgi:hypothetical protein
MNNAPDPLLIGLEFGMNGPRAVAPRGTPLDPPKIHLRKPPRT